jgi:hypothetical protein
MEDYISQESIIEECALMIRTFNNINLKENLDKIEDINKFNEYNNSLAFVAAWNGNLEALIMLMERNIKIDGLISIAGARHLCILNFLREEKLIQATFKDKDGNTPLQQAVNLRNPSCPFGSLDVDITEDRLDCMELLISLGANVNETNKFGRTSIMSAVNINWYDATYMLLEANADTGILCKDNKKAIDYTEEEDLIELINNKERENLLKSKVKDFN